MDGGDDDDDGRSGRAGRAELPPLLVALKRFVHDLRNPAVAGILRQARASDRATEIVENAIRHQVDITFRQLRGSAMRCVETTYERCIEGDDDDDDDDDDIGDDGEAGGGGGGGDGGESKDGAAPAGAVSGRLKKQPKALAHVAMQSFNLVLTSIDDVLQQLKPLIVEGMALLPEDMRMDSVFSELVQGHLHEFFLWFSSAMEEQCEANSTVAATLAQIKRRDSAPGADGRRPRGLSTRRISSALPELPSDPRFILVLSFMCSLLEQKGVTKSISMLLECLPDGNERGVSLHGPASERARARARARERERCPLPRLSLPGESSGMLEITLMCPGLLCMWGDS